MSPKFGVQAAAFTKEIHAGSLNAACTMFTRKEDVTEDALRAVAEFVLKHFEGSGRFEFADDLTMDVEAQR